MICYLTFNDPPSGIYSSQVLDVVKFIRTELKQEVKLVALISARNYFSQKKLIKAEEPQAIVLPMFPGIKNWKKNLFTLKFISSIRKSKLVIGRSVMATQLSLFMKKKTVYDGRGAIAAEWKEYGVISDAAMREKISAWEKECVQQSSFRIAVSDALVNYWKTEYQYAGEEHVIIPCTLNKQFEDLNFSEEAVEQARTINGFKADDIVFVYSGSVAGWQSFDLLNNFLEFHLRENVKVKALFLSERTDEILNLEKKFPGRIICKKVSAHEVPSFLIAADYGLLIREKSVTNKVASPVKFAEYLACGLKVIISEELGDASLFVKNNNCGFLYTNPDKIIKPDFERKSRIRNLAMQYFRKINFKQSYARCVA